ncbi:MAG: alpha-1,4-glucan--maltose-1-phosphate maltosyltransferase [Pseudomonadota bacterium]|nr:MAG: alpha-1,4-glucan--maltose-1-phosphate maltosyltransferase [Pseudomonadota bacterium]
MANTATSKKTRAATESAVTGSTGGRRRVVIENVRPQIDDGRFPIKRVVGERVVVEADAFGDGHDRISCVLLYRREQDQDWQELPMRLLGNDRWRAEFRVAEIGRYRYSVSAWVDHYETWRHDLERRPDTDRDLPMVLQMGAALIEAAAHRARGLEARRLQAAAEALTGEAPLVEKRHVAGDDENARLMHRYAERRFIAGYERELTVVVDRELARFSAWYEFFPRSCGEGSHGRFADCEPMLDYIAGMGFDVVYLPPIHPIGHKFRKGRNNVLTPESHDVGSPWAIGGPEGGHKAVHPELGTLEDFRRFVASARARGLEVALDIAYQCSPDHPYVHEHPQWFRHRPDGSIQYAENPPKKYQDIYPFDFECEAWESLWTELKSIVEFWIEQGVRIFRVDNPHTKPFPFWAWLIDDVKRAYPDVLFLAEAFTRPKIMHRLAKLGFTQSYTYFTWRNSKGELIDYFTELTRGQGREYFRPNVWPNTPDILNEYLQFGGRAAFMIRLTLAATLAASYGIYGPAFELAEGAAREPGSEEYLDSEKYQVRRWQLTRADSLHDFVALVNRIRRENPALQSDWDLRFHAVDNDKIICFSKTAEDLEDIVLVVVNLDPHHRQSGWVELPLDTFNIGTERPYQMHDLLTGARYLWYGARNYVELDPQSGPAHIFRLRRRVRREHDFDYFL